MIKWLKSRLWISRSLVKVPQTWRYWYFTRVMMTKEGSTKIVNFITPGQGFFAGAWPHKSYSENALFLWKSSSLLPGIDQTNSVLYSSDDQGSLYMYQNCKFHEPRGRVLLGHGHISHKVKMNYLVLRNYNVALLCHFLFFFSIMWLLICKYELF